MAAKQLWSMTKNGAAVGTARHHQVHDWVEFCVTISQDQYIDVFSALIAPLRVQGAQESRLAAEASAVATFCFDMMRK